MKPPKMASPRQIQDFWDSRPPSWFTVWDAFKAGAEKMSKNPHAKAEDVAKAGEAWCYIVGKPETLRRRYYVKRPRKSIKERIPEKIRVDEAGCWLWQGKLNREGYGTFNRQVAHRAVYKEFAGPIPEGLVLDHLCRVRNCVNPEHLEPVTGQENTFRARRLRRAERGDLTPLCQR